MLREHVGHPEQAELAAVSLRDALTQEALRRDRTDIRLSRKISEESIRTELCEGPIPDSPPRPRTPQREDTKCSDRAELIERIKRGESPTWVPQRHVSPVEPQISLFCLAIFIRALTTICTARIDLPANCFPLSQRQP